MSDLTYWHAMLRVSDPVRTLKFFEVLGLKEVERIDNPEGRFTLYFLANSDNADQAQVELTHNWDESDYETGRAFGHLCFYVADIYAFCKRLIDAGVEINRPPRDGFMAFIKSPDGISIELVQAKRKSLPVGEPWASMPNIGTW